MLWMNTGVISIIVGEVADEQMTKIPSVVMQQTLTVKSTFLFVPMRPPPPLPPPQKIKK